MAEPDWRSLADEYGPAVALLVLFAFMMWVRLRPVERVITESAVHFSGNDPWYHARMVHYAVRYFPSTPAYDPFSFFPYGTGRHSGFGGLFDQLIALGALIVGLGDPSPRLIEVVTAYAPVVFGAVTVIPVYLISKRLMDRWSALIPTLLLALINGQFLTRTVVGSADHQAAEAFFGSLAVFGFIYAFQTAYREQPTRADIEDRNWRILRRPIIAGLLGGVAIAAYLMMWGPGIFLVFTMGLFVVIQLSRDYLDERSTEYLTFGTAIAMLTAGVLTLAYAKSYTLSATSFSLLQPLVLVGIAGGSVFMWFLADRFRSEGYEPRYYPAAVAALILGTLLAASVVYPRVIGLLESLIVRIYGFGLLSSTSALTVREIAPATLGTAWDAYAILFPLAVGGLVILGVRVIRENRPLELLVVLWSLTITSAYFTMIRFGYYFGVTVAILAGFAIWWTVRLIDLHEIRDISDLETYQVLVVLIILLAVLPGQVIAIGGTSAPAWETADRRGGSNTAWQAELTWMNDNTPEIPLEYYGQYEAPADEDFEYPDGAYGVMSWWDYGHWITYTAERIPDANPFQQGPRPASAFLLAENETRANLILEALPTREARDEIPNMTVEELQATVDGQSAQQAQEDTRYVVIDDQMAAGKFAAIATWTGPGSSTYFSQQSFSVGDSEAELFGTNDRYQNTMLARLYLQDANGLSHYRLVHESGQSAIVSVARETPQGYQSTNFINQRLSEAVFQSVQQRPDLAFYDVKQPASVKTFERVPGATLTGQVPSNNATAVLATVQLQTNRGRNFSYVQTVETDADGQFEMTVPYATTNSVTPADGGTDSGVVAQGRYQLYVGNPFQPTARGNTSVPEPAIYDGETIQVDLEPVERPSGNESDTSNSTSNESALVWPTGSGPTASLDAPGGQVDRTGTTSVLAEPRRPADG